VPGSVNVGFEVDKVALGQVSLSYSVLPCQYHYTVALHTHITFGGRTIGPLMACSSET
jgi:hypothetical protein